MREILFRGKRTDNGDWVEGYLVKVPIKQDLYNTYRIYYQPFEGASSNTYHQVIPETVGQFTGLTDKNGKRIFEGDKIKYYQPYSKKWEEGFVKWDDCWACFGVYKSVGDEYCHETDWVKIQEIEVLGNIHDNPELLKGDKA